MFKELINKFISEGIPFLVIPQNKERVIRISTDKANIVFTSPDIAFIDTNIDANHFEMFVDVNLASMPRILSENKRVDRLYHEDDIGKLFNDYFSLI